MTKREISKRFPYYGKKEDKKNLLVCFHHAGGSAMVFKPWLNKEVSFDIMPIEIPGRGTRFDEQCLTDFESVVNDSVNSILAINDGRPVYIYGHSLGSLIAFEVTDKLIKEFNVNVKKLFVAGRVAPQDQEPSTYRSSMGKEKLKDELSRIGATSDDVLNDECFCEYMLPMIHSDYKLSENYRYSNEKINCPIVALNGSEDEDAEYETMSNWKEVTNKEFVQYEFDGNHFFPYGDEIERVIQMIDKEIV